MPDIPKKQPEYECLQICDQIEEVLSSVEILIRPVLGMAMEEEMKPVTESEATQCDLKKRLKGLLQIICDIRSRIDT